MKLFSIFLLFASAFLMSIQVVSCVKGDYNYEKQLGSYWELADKSSTLSEKSIYITKFLDSLKASKHSDYGSVVLQTPSESWELNIRALQSLKDRLEKIRTMDEKSFEYQTAIQQITAQEQGDAKALIGHIKEAWCIENYPLFSNFYGGIFATIWIFLLCFGGIVLWAHFD